MFFRFPLSYGELTILLHHIDCITLLLALYHIRVNNRNSSALTNNCSIIARMTPGGNVVRVF